MAVSFRPTDLLICPNLQWSTTRFTATSSTRFAVAGRIVPNSELALRRCGTSKTRLIRECHRNNDSAAAKTPAWGLAERRGVKPNVVERCGY